MLELARILHLIASCCAFGLLLLVILYWASAAPQLRQRLERFYAPFLIPLRARFQAVKVGSGYLDLSPAILLAGILVVDRITMYLLLGGP